MTPIASSPPEALRVLETCLYVDDLETAEDFYSGVMGLRLVSRQDDRHAFFRCSSSMLLLFRPEESRRATSDVPVHGAAGAGHVAFAVSANLLARWKHHLETWQVPIERTVDWPNGARSLYFRDPAGNSLELATPHLWNLPP